MSVETLTLIPFSFIVAQIYVKNMIQKDMTVFDKTFLAVHSRNRLIQWYTLAIWQWILNFQNRITECAKKLCQSCTWSTPDIYEISIHLLTLNVHFVEESTTEALCLQYLLDVIYFHGAHTLPVPVLHGAIQYQAKAFWPAVECTSAIYAYDGTSLYWSKIVWCWKT